MPHLSIRSLGVRLGGETRDNDWYREHRPEEVAREAERGLARAFNRQDGNEQSRAFDEAMAAHLSDPFRGATVRHVLAPGETCQGLELAAARDALAAAEIAADEVDVLLCASWLPERFVAPGDAVFLAAELGVEIPAWNLETACSSGLALLLVAEGLLATGRARRVLLVCSSTNSRQTDDTLGWISSDVAAAAVVERPHGDEGLLGAFTVNTAATCGVFEHRLEAQGEAGVVRMRVGADGARALRETSGPGLVRRCCDAALARSGLTVDQIAWFGFSTPLAWFARMCADAMGVPPERAPDLFPRLANVGAPFPFVHLYHGLAEGSVGAGELGMVYTVGSVSSAGAAVLRLGEIALGPPPRTVRA